MKEGGDLKKISIIVEIEQKLIFSYIIEELIGMKQIVCTQLVC